MKDLLENLLYSDFRNPIYNYAMLGFRILFAIELFRVHGLKKFKQVDGKKLHEPNPLHLPQGVNDFIATFADTVVPLLLIFGAFTRLAVLPAIGVTSVGYFVVHRKDPLPVRDVPYIYTIVLLLILMLGPGYYSLDTLILRWL